MLYKYQILLLAVTPSAPAASLQQKDVVRINMRSDAATRCRIADHDVVESRIRHEREPAQQRVDRGINAIDALHEQCPAGSGQPPKGAAREWSRCKREMSALADHKPRLDLVAARKRDQTVARKSIFNARARMADQQRFLLPILRHEPGGRSTAEQRLRRCQFVHANCGHAAHREACRMCGSTIMACRPCIDRSAPRMY